MCALTACSLLAIVTPHTHSGLKDARAIGQHISENFKMCALGFTGREGRMDTLAGMGKLVLSATLGYF